MSDEFDRSVTFWLDGLKQGQNDAIQQIWQRYFQQLVHVANRKLGGASRRTADEEDVALSAFKSLCFGAAAGRFERLEQRDDLWQVLVAIAGRKAVDQIRRQTSQKRGAGTVRGDSIVMNRGGDAPGTFEQFVSDAPTPEMVASMDEEYSRLLSRLPDETMRGIARLRLEGYANEEIATELQLSLRSVERKLGLIREIWSLELAQQTTDS
ncbi:MAG: hypothetical protein JNG89_12035 [Planctomycetaceae bacterium]|nr:hypothetical protein [Planctomycetaceae bacterium]